MNFVNFIFFPSQSYRSTQKHFQDLPKAPDFMKHILEKNRSMRTMIFKHSHYSLPPIAFGTLCTLKSMMRPNIKRKIYSKIRVHHTYESVKGTQM